MGCSLRKIRKIRGSPGKFYLDLGFLAVPHKPVLILTFWSEILYDRDR